MKMMQILECPHCNGLGRGPYRNNIPQVRKCAHCNKYFKFLLKVEGITADGTI